MAKTVDVTIKGKDESKAAFDSAHKHAEDFGARVKQTLNIPFDYIKALFAVELVAVVGEFFKGAVEAAAEFEAQWARVASAVDNAGISFQGVHEDLRNTFAAVSDGTRFAEHDVAAAFATVLNISNDYAGSVKNLGLITNLAVAKQLDLNTAATIVGKAMEGQTTLLKRYGIIIKDGADAIDELNKRMHGFAEEDGKSLQGRLHQLANEWDEFKVRVGLAITGSDDATVATTKLTAALHGLSVWVEENTGPFQTFVGVLADVGRTIAWDLGQLKDFVGYVATHGVLADAVRGVGGAVAKAVGKVGEFEGKLFYGAGSASESDVADADAASIAANAPALRAARARKAAEEAALTAAQIAENSREAAAAKKKLADEAAAKAMDKRIADLKQEGELLLKGRDILGLTIKDYARLAAIEAELKKLMADASQPLRVRAAAAEFLTKQADELKKNAQEYEHVVDQINKTSEKADKLRAQLMPDVRAKEPSLLGLLSSPRFDIRPTAAALPQIDPLRTGVDAFATSAKTGFGDATKAVRELNTSVDSLGYTLGDVAGGALLNFVGTWTQGIEQLIAGHENLAHAIITSVRKAVGQSLLAKGRETSLEAAAAAAEGFSNPAKFLQAARLFAAGSAEIAAGAAFSGGGGGGSGGGSGGGGVSPAGYTQSQGSAAGAGKLTVIFPGKRSVLDPTDPGDLDALREMFEHLAGTRQIEFVVGA